MITLTTKIERSDGLLVSDVDNETVIMEADSGRYHGLNFLATHIWNSLDSPVTAQLLCDRLMDEYDVSRRQCETDVLDFLTDLLDRGVIRVVEQHQG